MLSLNTLYIVNNNHLVYILVYTSDYIFHQYNLVKFILRKLIGGKTYRFIQLSPLK